MMTMLHHMENINRDIFKRNGGTLLVVQWLRLYTSTAGDTGLNPGQGSFESCMVLQKKKKTNENFGFEKYSFKISLERLQLQVNLSWKKNKWMNVKMDQ